MTVSTCPLTHPNQNSTFNDLPTCHALNQSYQFSHSYVGGVDKKSLGYGLGVVVRKVIDTITPLISKITHFFSKTNLNGKKIQAALPKSKQESSKELPRPLKLNTSNLGKFKEFQQLFASHGNTLEASHVDLREIDADPISVVTHKASQLGENIIVEDTSLEIEGATVGINVRWLLTHLHEYAGRKADWTVLLAYRQDNKVLIYKGSVSGTIVKPRGTTGFGFDPVFLPNGAMKTLAESKPDQVNARAKAVEALLQKNVWNERLVLKKWEGPWQKDDHE